ncbi:MAG: GTPase Era [Propionibacteriaceae bacterium]|jgi:GTP-binding protein Era|nr:GTPase Era [Propionibacteriaceae bacterium]
MPMNELAHSGFCAVVGRPNAGKSTLTNALVGAKVAIMSSKPQTTRRAIRGIVNRDDAQLVLVDTPGLHRPRTLLGERLNDLVYATWSEVDVIAVCLPCNERVGPGDKFLIRELLAQSKAKLVALATKADLVGKTRLAEHLLSIQAIQVDDDGTAVDWASIIPVSALTGEQLDVVAAELIKLLPPGPRFYPGAETTDEPDEAMIAELIREAALEIVWDELPHSIAVQIDEMRPREGRPETKPLLDIFASIVLERDSQKGIIIGHKGERLKQIGSNARQQIQTLLGTPVHLALHVKIQKDWQRDPKALNKLGF